MLLAGSGAPQSGLALDDDPELLFDYNQRFYEIILSQLPQSVLVIGGGAFTFPKAVAERFPSVSVDVVEIDPLLLELARKYFELPNSPNLSVVIGDGRQFIAAHQAQYDFIVVDAFKEYDIPRSFITPEAAQDFARLLRPKGTLAINLIAAYYTSQPTLAHEFLEAFGGSFASIDLYPTDPHYPRREEQNYLLVASHDPSPNLDYLQSAPVKKDI